MPHNKELGTQLVTIPQEITVETERALSDRKWVPIYVKAKPGQYLFTGIEQTPQGHLMGYCEAIAPLPDMIHLNDGTFTLQDTNKEPVE